jgi:CheY-like chemotaxis protein
MSQPEKPAPSDRPSTGDTGERNENWNSHQLPPGILVVDDDEQVRRLLDVVLRQSGFTVFGASSGASAVEVFRANRNEIVVALIDVFMPNNDGVAALQWLRAIDPLLCCCFITGGAGEYSVGELFAEGAAIVFHKPFDLNHLTRVLRHLIFGPALSDSGTVRPSAVAQVSEKRRFPRWPGIRQDVDVTPLTGSHLQRSATVVNRSLGGVGLESELPGEIGSMLRIRSQATAYEKWLTIEIRHSRPIGDRWMLGGRFSEPATLGLLSVYG